MKYQKNTLLLLISSFTSFSGNSMHFIALSWFLLEKTNNPILVGTLVSMGAIPGILASPFTGAIIDRYNRKILAACMDVGRGLIVILLAIVCLMEFSGFIVVFILIISLILSLLGNFYFPAISAILKDIYTKEEMAKVLSINGVIIQISSILGAAFSGIIISHVSIATVLVIDAGTFLISALCIFLIKYPVKQQFKNSKIKLSIFQESYKGIIYSIKDRYVLFLIIIGLLPSSTIYIVNSTLGSYTNDILGLESSAYGILVSSYAIGSILVGVVMFFIKHKFQQLSIVMLGYFILIFSFVLIASSQQLIISIIGFSLLGLACMLINPTRRALLLTYVNSNYVGRVSSFNWLVYTTFGPLLGLLSTLIIKYSYLNLIFYILGLFAVISLISLIFFKKKQRQIEESEIVKV